LLGDTVAEIFSCIYVYVRYLVDLKGLKFEPLAKKRSYRLLSTISHIALPITSGRYLNSLLRMTENVLVPICLSANGGGQSGISLFGMIKGMALPILFFPSSLLGALSTLLLPEISEAAARGRNGIVRSIVERIIKITSLISIIFSALFFVCGKNLGALIYNSEDVGFLLCALSPIVPFMYLDAISDGILKGLDQQKFTFFTSISDSFIRILLVLAFLKRFGIYGFIGIMYFSNFLTGFLNTKRLLNKSGLKLCFSRVFVLPFCGAFSICLVVSFLLKHFLLAPNIIFLISLCTICVAMYIGYLFLLGIVDPEDLNFIKRK